MRTALVLLVAAGTLFAAPVPKDFKRCDDARVIVGTWKAHRLTLHGQEMTAIDTHTFDFEADGKCSSTDARGQRLEWTYTLDWKATPKRMRWVASHGRGVSFDCLYELSGDSFKLGFLADGQPVPDKVSPGPTVTLYEMTRVR